jgi:VanZ family protein
MSNSERDLGFWLRAWLPVVLGVGVIALESTILFSAQITSGPLRALYQALFGPVGNLEWSHVHFYIRKSGHFLGYGLLALAWLRAWWMTLPRSVFMTDALLALVGTAMTAGADELHQTFLPGRTGTPWDVLIDCLGAITLQLVVYVGMRIFRPKRLARLAEMRSVQPCEPARQRTRA